MPEDLVITGPYRITSEVAEFTGDALDEDGLPKQGWAPHRVSGETQWFEADGTPITDQGRIWDLEERLIAKERE